MVIENNKTVVVTGGSRGIGKAIVNRFLEAGYHVVSGARAKPQDNFASPNLKNIEADVRHLESHLRLVNAALSWTGRLDVYVNCAGFSRWSTIEKIDEAFMDTMLDTNLKGTFWGCKAASERMEQGASIINISSLAGKRGSANNSIYCASKFGVNGITQALAKELGGKGIRVNAVCPVYIRTDGVVAALTDGDSPTRGVDVESYFDSFAKSNSALQRLPNDNEVANLCYFLASEEASAITGQCINVDCGVLPQ